MDLLIFATVGTSKLQFNRLLKILDQLCEEKVIDGNDLLVQIGYSTYFPQNYKTMRFVDNDEHHRLLAEAEYVITHSGTGSVITSLKAKKKVIVFPRLAQYREHADDHQLELASFFSQIGCLMSASDKKELVDCINMLPEYKPVEFVSNNHKMNQILIDYIDNNV